jgi:hypothetical protein
MWICIRGGSIDVGLKVWVASIIGLMPVPVKDADLGSTPKLPSIIEMSKKYKASELVKITDASGNVSYGLPNHIPMQNWNDYTVISSEEVEEG